MISYPGINGGKLPAALQQWHLTFPSPESFQGCASWKGPNFAYADCWTVVCYELIRAGTEPLNHPALAFPLTHSQFKAGFSLSSSFGNSTLLLDAREDAGGGGFALEGGSCSVIPRPGDVGTSQGCKSCCSLGMS